MRQLIPLLIVLLAACATAPAGPAPPTVPPSAAPAPPATPRASLPATPTDAPRPTAAPPTVTPLPHYDLVLTGATLIDGTGAPPRPEVTVAIRDGRIAAVERAGQLAYSADTPVRELTGATLLPGFINAHAHTSDLDDTSLRAWTRAGITTVRDLGGPIELLVDLRARSAADPTLPRLLVAGPIVTVQGSFSTEIYGVSDELLLVDGPDDARAKVRTLLNRGADLVKLAVSGRTDVQYAELSDAELAAVVEAARERGAHVAAHVDRAVALRRAVTAGVSSAAHSPRDRIPDNLIALMVEREISLVPTIAVYEALAVERGNLAAWRRTVQPVMYDNLRRFAAAGGTLALGDDYGGAPDQTVGMPMAEIEHWLATGLTPMQVIVAATSGGARILGLGDELGVIAPGLAADILAVDGDPLTDITALTRPLLVLHGGHTVR